MRGLNERKTSSKMDQVHLAHLVNELRSEGHKVSYRTFERSTGEVRKVSYSEKYDYNREGYP